jgi:glycosyltransferase involved in cell wall biosynthesis
MSRIIIAWGLWGPYHRCRFEAFRDHAAREGHQVTGVSLFSGSRDYQWLSGNLPEGVVHFNLGKDETILPLAKIGHLLAIPRKLRTEVALLPSYFNWSLALNTSMRLYGGRVVMMNETHAGTVRARGLKAAFKQRVVAGFHAGFVGGEPQRRYFASLGLPGEKIFTGYDAVDNELFASKSADIRSRQSEVRKQYQLPKKYFLNLGRFVPKKNLSILIQAYRKVLDSSRDCQTHLVMVGSGEEDPKLRMLCQELKLPVYDKTALKTGTTDHGSQTPDPNPGVHFYGFRQIEENPVFYALADAFVLPSLWEEWGLVVNEAMACGLPVVVSETAGCAEDLLGRDRLATPPGLTADLRLRLAQLTGRIRENGFLFSPNSVQSLADALIILEAVPELRGNMGQASRSIVEKFSCANFARNALCAARAALGN